MLAIHLSGWGRLAGVAAALAQQLGSCRQAGAVHVGKGAQVHVSQALEPGRAGPARLPLVLPLQTHWLSSSSSHQVQLLLHRMASAA